MLGSGKCQQDADTGDLIPAVEVDDLATARAVRSGQRCFWSGGAVEIEVEVRARNRELLKGIFRDFP